MYDTVFINRFIMDNLQYIILSMTVMLLLALIIFININIKMSKLNNKYRKMMLGAEGKNIEQMLVQHIEEVRALRKQLDEITVRCTNLESSIKDCVQKVGVVRFNAFEDTGSDLSFAIALLNAKNNGVVLTSIFGRSESRSYAKPIENGQSSYFLTDEEKQALEKSQINGLK